MLVKSGGLFLELILKKYLFTLIAFLILASLPRESRAGMCLLPSDYDPIKTHSIIFKGKFVGYEPLSFVDEIQMLFGKDFSQDTTKTMHMTVEIDFKGSISGKDVYLRKGRQGSINYMAPLIQGHDYIIYTDESYTLNRCGSEWIDLTPPKPQGPYDYSHLVKFKAEREALLKEADEKKTEEAFLRKARFLEEYGELDAAIETYRDILQLKAGGKNILQEVNPSCIGNMEMPPDIGNTAYNIGWLLTKREKFEDALRPLCLSARSGIKNARQLHTLAMIKTGKHSEVEPQHRSLKNISLETLTLNGDFKGWDFSGMKIEWTLSARNSDFSDANFNQAKLRVDWRSVKALKADFSHAEIGGFTENCDFSHSDFRHARAGIGAKNGKFVEANLSKAYLSLLSSNADFTGANMEEVQIDPDRHMDSLHPVFKNANLKKAQLRGLDLRDADFRGADLTGADLTSFWSGKTQYQTRLEGADFSTAILKDAKLDGAEYNCATKFPEDFDTDKLLTTETCIFKWFGDGAH